MNRPRRPHRSSSKPRAARLQVDHLEDRQLLSSLPSLTAGLVVQPTFHISQPSGTVQPLGGTSPANTGYIPSQIQQAYGFNQIKFGSTPGDGRGQTIAIVDAYDDPNIQNDLNLFDSTYGIAATTVTRYNQQGLKTGLPSSDSSGGWELEESLDVEWAHAMAPGATIVLFEAASSSDSDLLAAVASASKMASVVSMSWGGGEFPGENSYDSYFSTPGVSYVASSGDNGAPISWPSSSPNVLAVGGTALTLDGSNNISKETGWSGSGGGPSSYEAQPSYQSGVVTQTKTQRANPDVAYDASPSTGFSIYDSVAYSGSVLGWLEIGGTSAGAPQWASLLAIVNQGRVANKQPLLDSSSTHEVMTTLYANATTGDFHDITTGSSSGSPTYSAGPGYDYVTGLGTPLANKVVQSFDGSGNTNSPDTLIVSGPTTAVAGTSFTITVTADTSAGAKDPNYTGTVKLTSSDPKAVLPGSYTFLASDGGSHTFTVTLETAGAQSITSTDAANSTITATLSGITVSPAAVSQLLLTGLATTETAGIAQSFTVTAKDAYGNLATNDTDTVKFTSSDAQASLPATSTLTNGVGTFTLTFETAGTQSLTATDTSHTAIFVTATGITVNPAAPTGLVASGTSTSHISLSWSAGAGDTGYIVQRSTSSTSGFAQIGTTAAGTTSYTDTGLSSGTTYYYRVQATGGGLSSAYSNVASSSTKAADHFVISGQTTDIAGTSFTITVTADNTLNRLDNHYAGTVQLTSSDGQAVLPAAMTLTNGVGTFTVTLKTAGTQSITATDTANSTITATLSGITVSPAAVSQLLLTGLATTETAGISQSFTVTAKDAYGNVATNDTDTVKFTSSDAQASLPATSTLTNGVGTFTLTFETAGTQSLTATDTSHTAIFATASGITVNPATPTSLSATATSSSQITLSWTAAAGDTGYNILRSTSSTSGFSQIGTTAAGTTTYQDSGLSAGTTYYYEVQATGGGFSSGDSNVASATTTGSGTTGSGGNTIWSNSYVPPENAYGYGSYDLGVKFTASKAGNVTGLRFYKQTWMSGPNHVGYLWSSTGTLLASASFSTETSSGWQQINLSSPVSILANTVYIVSFSTGGGYFGVTTGFFLNNNSVTNGPLQALADGVSGGDGVYQSGSSSFPIYSQDGDNFWADVAFTVGTTTKVAFGGGTSSTSTNSDVIVPGLVGGQVTLTNTVFLASAGQPSALTISIPDSPEATTPFQGRHSLFSSFWSARRNPSPLVTQADLSSRKID